MARYRNADRLPKYCQPNSNYNSGATQADNSTLHDGRLIGILSVVAILYVVTALFNERGRGITKIFPVHVLLQTFSCQILWRSPPGATTSFCGTAVMTTPVVCSCSVRRQTSQLWWNSVLLNSACNCLARYFVRGIVAHFCQRAFVSVILSYAFLTGHRSWYVYA